MRNAVKIPLALSVLAAVACGVAMSPDRWVAAIGGSLSPRGAISASFVPVFRKVLVFLGVSSGAALLGILFWGRQARPWIVRVFRRVWCEGGCCARGLRDRLRHTTRLEFAGIAVLLAVGVGIRLWYLHQPMRFDEATTVTMYANAPWYLGLANYSMPNNHLFNTLLVRFSVWMGGDREWVVRMPALLAGLLCLPLAYVYARLMYSRETALLALAWLCVSLPFVDMSTNARGYTMVACGGLVSHLSIYCILRKGYWLAALLNALAIGLGLVAVPVAILFVGSGLLWAAFCAISLRGCGRLDPTRLFLFIGSVCAGFGIALTGYLPMLLIMGPKWLLANEWVRPLGWATFLRQLPGELQAFGRYDLLYLPPAMVAGVALSAGFYLLFWRKIERTRISLPFLLAGVCLFALTLNRRFPLWGLAPMWMFLSVVLCSAISAGFSRMVWLAIGARFARPLILVAALALSGVGACNLVRANPRQTLDPAGDYAFPDIPQVVRYLAGQATSRDEILLDNAMIVHQYYAQRCGAGHLNWGWNANGPRRIFVLETSNPNPRFADAMWRRLHDLGIQTTNDMAMAAEFSDHKIWIADVKP